MSHAVKLLGAITALVVAVTGLWVAISGGDGALPAGITVVLDSPEAFHDFIANHPATG